MQFSLLSPQRNIKEILAVCRELNIDFLAYSPLALGVLAVNPSDNKVPKTFARRILYQRLLPGSTNLRNGLRNIGLDHNASQVQVALNWCRAHGTIPIPGIRTPSQAQEIVAASKWKLSRQEREYLDQLSNRIITRMPNNPFLSD